MKNITILATTIACALTLTACGGGGDDNSITPLSRADEGIWSNNNGGVAVILDDGSYWGTYGAVTGNSTCNPYGVLQGTASVSGTNVSGTYTDFSLMGDGGFYKGTYSGTVSAQSKLNLTFNDQNPTSFTPTAFNGIMSYDSAYNQPASLSAIAGSYLGGGCQTNGGGPAVLPGESPAPFLPIFTVSGSNLTLLSPDGETTIMTGTLAPHGTVNVFDVSLTTAIQYGEFGVPMVPAGTIYKGILFQTPGSPGYIEMITAAGNSIYSYRGAKQN
jgi:hypothetical protein